VVNTRMETSAPNIYACGDCAELYDFLGGNYRAIPIWPAAYISGTVAGSNMAELPREFDGGIGMNSMHLFGFPVISFGKVNPAEADGCEILSKLDEKRKAYRKIVLSGNRIVGVILIEDIDRAGILLGLMRKP
jgi:NAD(P)H-nitrite reductase large subunit